jgi:hypothetical protein
MRDAMFGEKRVQTLILASPISLNNNDLSVKTSFYHILEFYEFLEHIRFRFQHVDEGYIIPLMTY